MAMRTVSSPEDFEREVLRSKGPVLVLFQASWCSFCQAFLPAFEARAKGLGGRVVVAELEDMGNPLWDAYRVQVVPTLAYFRGGVLVARKDGRFMRGLSDAELDEFLRKVLPVNRAG